MRTLTEYEIEQGKISWKAQCDLFIAYGKPEMIAKTEELVKNKGAEFVFNSQSNQAKLAAIPVQAKQLFKLGLMYLEYTLNQK